MTKLGQMPTVPSLALTHSLFGKQASGPTDVQILLSNLINSMFVPMTDYASASTIIGWSSFTDKIIRYSKLGNMLFVWFVLRGVSNSVNTSFTIPYNGVSATASGGSGTPYTLDAVVGLSVDNGAQFNDPTRIFIDPNVAANKVTLLLNNGTGNWTASGTKDVRGEFWVETV